MGSKMHETTNENATVLHFCQFCKLLAPQKNCEMLNWKVAIENTLVSGLAASKSEGCHMIGVTDLLTFDY